MSPSHREASEHLGKWQPGRGTEMEISTVKEHWELTEGVMSSIAEGESGIGSVRTPWYGMLVDQ